MKESVKEFDVSVNVSFNVSFQMLANNEAQALTKIENLLEIIRNEATVDCHIHPSYDVYVDEVEAKLNQLSYWKIERGLYMNNVQLLGNLARDAELRFTQNGKAVAIFTVAATNTYVDSTTNETKEQTAFINCVAWGKTGEAVGNCKKGDRLLVNGRIQTRSYEDNNGQKKYVTEVVADFVGKKLDGEFDSSNFDSFETTNQDENIPF